MHCKYSAELKSSKWIDGNYILNLRVEKEGTEWNAERELTPQDFALEGVFDIVFDDLKKMLKYEIKKSKLAGVAQR